MTKEASQETFGVEDEEALKRASIEELYKKKKYESEKKDSDTKESINYKTRFAEVSSVLLNPRKFGGKVTGLDVDPSMPDNINDVLDISKDDINRIRFEIDGKYDTNWYSWGSDELDNIIEYYSDGDISEFISLQRLSYNEVNETAFIGVPDDINSRTSIIVEKINERRRVLNKMGYNTSISISKLDFASYLSFYCLAVMAFVLGISINADLVTNGFILILMLFVHLMIGAQLALVDRTHGIDKHFKPLYYPIIRSMTFLYHKVDTI
jgi:hypothetical protein